MTTTGKPITKATHRVPSLRFVRESKGMSQEKLAEKAKVGRATIARLEKGKVGANGLTLEKLAQALGVSRTDLKDEPKGREPEDDYGTLRSDKPHALTSKGVQPMQTA